MYPNYSYSPYGNQYVYNPYQVANPCIQQSNNSYNRSYSYYLERQQPVRGQATWTEGGPVTQCGIPWSDNSYMTAAVGTNTPYTCGQTLKVKSLSSQREVLVEVVDQVAGYPANKINLHRRAFLALGEDPSIGVINVEITQSPDIEQEEWGKYLLAVTQAAYPSYNVTNYHYIGKTQVTPTQTKQTYEFILQSPQEQINVRGNVVYNSNTNRVISFDLNEV